MMSDRSAGAVLEAHASTTQRDVSTRPVRRTFLLLPPHPETLCAWLDEQGIDTAKGTQEP
jgi:hypothetical protein